MSAPKVTSVAESSPGALAGLEVGDELVSLNGKRPRDVIEYHAIVDGETVDLQVRREGSEGELHIPVRKHAGEPLGIAVATPVFDRVRTCDNHCAFCFIHQLPKGMRRSLYLKDDDYRLSFLYGNFTTLTRFTELDAERVLTERLSPLFVSIHATDPSVRASMLRNPKGATSLRWLEVILDGGIEVHGQIVMCPGVNNGAVFEDTLVTVLDRYPSLASLGVVPLGLSRFSRGEDMRLHTSDEAAEVCDTVERWQDIFHAALGRRLVHAADEYYLMAGRNFPAFERYEGFPQHENGIGMARSFERAFLGDDDAARGVRAGFFAWVDGAPATGYRARRADPSDARSGGPACLLTAAYGARVLEGLVGGVPGVRVLTVEHDYFGGNIGVAGLLTGHDLSRALEGEPEGERYLLPDACLSEGRFLDGLTLSDLPREVEVVPTDGRSLRQALGSLVSSHPEAVGTLDRSPAGCGSSW